MGKSVAPLRASDIPHRRSLDMKTNDRTEKERRMDVENENGRVFQRTSAMYIGSGAH